MTRAPFHGHAASHDAAELRPAAAQRLQALICGGRNRKVLVWLYRNRHQHTASEIARGTGLGIHYVASCCVTLRDYGLIEGAPIAGKRPFYWRLLPAARRMIQRYIKNDGIV